METKQPLKIVYTITERGDRSYWTRIGVAYTNRDGSLNLKLEAVPVNGTMQVREWTPRDEQPPLPNGKRSNGRSDDAPLDDLPDSFS
jgi:hypothetical protein